MKTFQITGRKQTSEFKKLNRFQQGINQEKPTVRHIVIQLSEVKSKEKILKAAREKQFIIYKGPLIRL